MASWIEVEGGPISLLPDEQKIVPYTIHIPQNADPGGHYAAVFFATQPPQMSGSSIGLSGRLGTLVLLTVSGDIKEEGKIVEFSTKDNKSFYEHLPVSFSLLFANSGNVHLKPQGEIKITNSFGGLSEKIPFNREEMDGSKNVLPNTSRHLEAVWSRGPLQTEGNGFIDKLNYEISNFALGRYKATINVGYGTQGKTAVAVATFWVFPWHLILVVSLAAAILISMLVAAIKNYNNWIVKQALKKRK